MKMKNLLILILLLSGLVILSACAPETPSSTKPQEPADSESADTDPFPTLPEESSNPYPYPAPGEEGALQPDDSEQSYPSPQDVTAGYDPYPGIEIVGSASDRDLSEAIIPSDFAVQSSDEDLLIEPVYIENSEIIIKEGDPAQVELILVGNLPTPCNQLRVVNTEVEENGQIIIQAYSVSDPDMMCTQVLQPFIAVVPLGEYSEGTYSLSINYEITGEFTTP